MDNQTLLKEALTDELGSLYKNITQLTDVKSLPEDDLQLLRGLVSVLQFAAQQMTQQQASGGKLTADVTALRDKVAQLQQENAAYKKQLQWIQDRVALSRTSTGKMQLKATLKQTLDIARDIAGASSGSIFLLNDARSEEHTSELQSLTNLVCRLLLEKKKNKKKKKKNTNTIELKLLENTKSEQRKTTK